MSEGIGVMPYARKFNLISLLSILIPFISIIFLFFARVSNAVMNKYAVNGHPCHNPLSSLKNICIAII